MNKKSIFIILIAVVVFIPLFVLVAENSFLNLKETYGHRVYTLGGQEITQSKDAVLESVKRWGWYAGKRHGRNIEYYGDTLKKRIEGQYKNDEKVGVWKHWDINGQLISETSFDKKKEAVDLFEAKGQALVFYQAVEAGEFETINKLIQSDVAPDIPHKGLYPIHEACWQGHINIVDILLQNGVDINARDKNGDCPMGYAAYRNNSQLLEFLIKNGADINTKSNHGMTPLHIAAKDGHTDIVKILLEHGAGVNTADNAGKTALHLTAKGAFGKCNTVAKLLIDYKIDVNKKDAEGITASDIAAKYNHPRLVELLQVNGATD